MRTNRGTFAFAVLLFILGLFVAFQLQLSGGRELHFPINDYWLSLSFSSPRVRRGPKPSC